MTRSLLLLVVLWADASACGPSGMPISCDERAVGSARNLLRVRRRSHRHDCGNIERLPGRVGQTFCWQHLSTSRRGGCVPCPVIGYEPAAWYYPDPAHGITTVDDARKRCPGPDWCFVTP